MSDFDEKLKRAIERGQNHSLASARKQRELQMTEDEIRRKHTDFRLAIADHIEFALQRVVDHLPGFAYETVYGDRGWGGAVSRDDVQIQGRHRRTLFSRLELTVRPYSDVQVVDLVSKGTIRNQEIFARDFHQLVSVADKEEFLTVVDQWVLDYVEQYSNQ